MNSPTSNASIVTWMVSFLVQRSPDTAQSPYRPLQGVEVVMVWPKPREDRLPPLSSSISQRDTILTAAATLAVALGFVATGSGRSDGPSEVTRPSDSPPMMTTVPKRILASTPVFTKTLCRIIPHDGEMAIMAAIASCPNGTATSPTTIQFPANSRYHANHRILISGRSNIVIDGNGSTFITTAHLRSAGIEGNWILLKDHNLTLEDMTAIGAFHLPAPRSLATLSPADSEADMNYGVYGGDTISLLDLTGSHPWGDNVAAEDSTYIDKLPDSYVNGLTIEGGTFSSAARMCFAPTSGTSIIFESNSCSDSWYGGVDAEIDNVKQPLDGIRVLHNTFNGFGQFGVAIPAAGINTTHIEISGNRFITATDPAYNVCWPIIRVGFYPLTPATFTDVVTDDNSMPDYGTGISYDHVNGGEVKGNILTPHPTLGCDTIPALVTNSTGIAVTNNEAIPAA